MGVATPPPTETSTVATPMTTLLPATATSTSVSATAALPPGTSASTLAMANITGTLPVEYRWGLPVVENATNFATSALRASSSRPTTCVDPSAKGQGVEGSNKGFESINRC